MVREHLPVSKLLLIPSAEVLSTLESHSAPPSAFSIKLPSARSVAKLWPQSENAIVLPHGSQSTINDQAHAFILALELSSVRGLQASWRDEMQLRLQRLYESVHYNLETSNQLESAVERLLNLTHNVDFLVSIFDRTMMSVPTFNVQTEMATALIESFRHDAGAVKDHLLPSLSTLASVEGFDGFHEDLKIAITTVLCRLCKPEDRPGRVQALHEALRQENVMTDSELMNSFRQLSVAQNATSCGPRRRKKRRISRDESEDVQAPVIQRTTNLLTGIETHDLTALAEVAPQVYLSLSKEEQCAAWQALTDLSSFDLTTTLHTVSKLVKLSELHQSREPRVFAMLAIRACVEKTVDPAYVVIRTSDFGQVCLRSLHSHLRELRVAAGQCLASFLRDELPTQLRADNRKVALEYLRVLSERDVANEQETLVGVWGQVALICEDAELNLALLRLVDYLGHSNPLICGLAFAELEKLAAAKGRSVDDLFKPFWSSIAVSVVQDLHSRPQKAQQLCDLLSTEVKRFLIMTQQETIPSLVLTKKKDILQRIAAARGNSTSVQDVCLQPKTHLAATLAVLLAQPGPDTEEAAAACLIEVAPRFRGMDITNLVKLDPALVACYMLKYIGDQSDSRKSRAYQAFQIFANIAERRPGQTRAHSKSSRMVIALFDTHILGIMTHFSEVLENNAGVYPTQEKVRCIKAIAEMINMNKRQVNAALPQIRAALQSSMEQTGLCEAAFAAWLALLSVLDGDDIGPVLDQSFALILRHWQSLSPELQQTIHVRIGNLVKNHNQVIQDNILTLPSLCGIPLLSKFGAEIERLASQQSAESRFNGFAKRLKDESRVVVLRALEELVPFLEKHQDFVHESAVSEQPTVVISELLRAVLDATTQYSVDSAEAAELCGKALGIIGSLDPNRVEATRKKRRVLVLSNFDTADEVIDWAVVLLEDVLVKAFKSVNNARAQGFLAYTMQELLRFCGFDDGIALRPRPSQASSKHQKWMNMPEHVRITLTPFVKSRYHITSNVSANAPNRLYPGFSPDNSHSAWMRSLAYDLMWKAKGDNTQMVFHLLARIIRGHDLTIASFMLPYTILNVVLGGTVAEMKGISDELLAILGCQPTSSAQEETIKLCSESVFNVLDYISIWLQEKRKALGETRAAAYRTGNSPKDFDEANDISQIDTVERFLASIPAEVIATQAVMCGSYARALFHWEQFVRQERPLIPSARPPQQLSDEESLYDKLQEIYAQIDEPDGLEGISAHLPFLNEEQQALQHEKAGRWTAAQAWYELRLADEPQDLDLEERLIGCLRETGRYAPLLRYADSFINSVILGEDAQEAKSRFLPAVVEAQWMSGDLDGMKAGLISEPAGTQSDFNIGVGRILAAVTDHNNQAVSDHISSLRRFVTQSMTFSRTSSIQSSHDDMRKLHVLHEIETLSNGEFLKTDDVLATLERRLSVIGSYVSDKQYVLGVRRTIMRSFPETFSDIDLGSSWLTTAKFARQSGNTEYAYNAVLKAHECEDKGSKLEEARLLWRDGHQRHAIQLLESAISSGAFDSNDADMRPDESGRTSVTGDKQNMLVAKATLLLAKWLDASGQSQAKEMTDKYQNATRSFQRWEKGHYYLGKHYQKLLDANKALPKDKQNSQLPSGELTRLVIENYLRSICYGTKYWHQTIPKILTLWLDLGSSTIKKAREEDQVAFDRRVKCFQTSTRQLQKYLDRVPLYVFYSAVPQMVSRITHPNPDVWKQLSYTLARIASAHPNQTLWSLLAVVKASDHLRVERGREIMSRLKEQKPRYKSDPPNDKLRTMIASGQRLSDGLLQACEAPVEPRVPKVSLFKDLGLNSKLAPNALVVPTEIALTASVPRVCSGESIRKHKPFVQDLITIHSFEDDVLVLTSLQRPRKLTVRGSDGKRYGLLCKPKDDLRKDQRLMEFNGVINRALKRDAESSKRRLYIKTYAVTPLSEESGTIEWVEGIKPIRDILLNTYARKGIKPNYPDLRRTLDEASAAPEHAHIFVEQVLPIFPASMHEWFTEVYPEPDTWFAARLRYARTAAVMSMVGHVLGLGDRHGENILLEESTGGVFHVDFNCLFDKGLTFEKPELVPFRLTHNMVDAMGPYGYEGPFRKSSELTMHLLRQSKDTLMTVLETFLYDPTTDFVGKKKHKTPGVPETPPEILEGIDGKLKGLLRGETVPLSTEGYVDALIREATSPWCLASMYIGWCAFL